MKTVIIVDDSRFMRTMINQALTDASYNVIGEAGDGETAIDLISSLNPDVVTLDNILPDMIGTDILAVLRSDKNIISKIVMISAVGNDSVIKEANDLGCNDYVVKPFTPESLVERINKLFL